MYGFDFFVDPTLCGAKSWGMVRDGRGVKNASKLTENPSCKEVTYIIRPEVGVWWGEYPVPLPLPS